MADFFSIGQVFTLILIASSVFLVATNELTAEVVPGGILGSNDQLTELETFVDVTEEDLTELDQEGGESIRSSQPGNPLTFMGPLVDTGIFIGKVIFKLLTGWTVLIDMIFMPYGLVGIASTFKSIFGIIEAFFLFTFLLKAVSVVTGGSA